MRMKLSVLLLSSFSSLYGANVVYVGILSSGLANGTSCANRFAKSYFNTAGNWSATPTGVQIGPDTTVHYCGTDADSLNATSFTFQGSGTSGHPVTLLFESGAILQSPAFSGNGAIVNGGNNYITIDLGTNGIIQNTANGTSGVFANSQDSAGIVLTSCLSCEIRSSGGGHITNIYNRTSGSTTDFNQLGVDIQVIGHSGSSNNLLIHDLTYDQASTGLSTTFDGAGNSNWQIYNTTCSASNACFVVADLANGTLDGYYFFGNTCTKDDVWGGQSSGGTHFHGNCFHGFIGVAANSLLNHGYIYNNTFKGVASIYNTSLFFTERSPNIGNWQNTYLFNNLFTAQSPFQVANGFCACVELSAYNNTVVSYYNSASDNGGQTFSLQDNYSGNTGQVAENNIIVSGSTAAGVNGSITSTNGGATYDYNLYWNPTNTPQFFGGNYSASCNQINTFAQWRSLCSYDLHGQLGNDPKLNAQYQPQAGSAAIAAGLNLFSICNGQATPGLGALCKDRSGVSRPSTGGWDVGAFQQSSGPSVSCAPSSIAFGNQTVNTTSAAQAITCTNGGGASATITSCALTGTNAAMFAITDPASCPGSLAINGSFTQHVTFTPTSAASMTANYTVTHDSGLTANTSLSGTGVVASPNINVTPSSVNCGSTNLNVQVTCPTFTVQNTGSASGTLSSISISGSGYSQTNSCGTLPITFAAGASCIVTPKFSPSTAGTISGTLTVVDTPDSQTATGSLTGVGVDPNAISLIKVNICTSQTFPGSCTIQATQSGDLLAALIVSAFNFAPTISSVTDNKADVWAEASNSPANTGRSIDASTNSMGDIWWVGGVPAGVTTVTITPNATGTMAAVIYEFSNVNDLDRTAVVNSQTTSASPSGAPVSPVSSQEAIVSFLNPQTSVTGIHAGNLFTNDSTTFSVGWAHLITSSTGTYTPQWDCSTTCTSNSTTASFVKSAPSVNSPGGVSVGGSLSNGVVH